ncbi:MAG: TetR/AcrR family transcriptional regulator [Pseudomonadales bacterium]
MARKTHKSQAAARTAILDAAEKVITEVGPAGLRISAVAKEAGMAHPNVIHHFGSREGLIAAVANRMGLRATDRITSAIKKAAEAGADEKLEALTEVLDTAFPGEEGRLVAWLHMSGVENAMDSNMKRILAVSQELRKTVDDNADAVNTNRLVGLITLALLGEVVYGSGITEALGFDNSQPSGPDNFRAWLASIVLGLNDDVLNTMTAATGKVRKK